MHHANLYVHALTQTDCSSSTFHALRHSHCECIAWYVCPTHMRACETPRRLGNFFRTLQHKITWLDAKEQCIVCACLHLMSSEFRVCFQDFIRQNFVQFHWSDNFVCYHRVKLVVTQARKEGIDYHCVKVPAPRWFKQMYMAWKCSILCFEP